MVRHDATGQLIASGNALLARQHYANAVKCYDKVIEIQPRQVDALHRRGIALRQLGRLVEALASHDRALTIFPGDPEGHYVRGNVLLAMNRCGEALLSYERALAIRPSYLAALHGHGMALRSLNRPEEALASYDKAVALRSDCVETLHNRAVVLGELGRNEEALADFDRAVTLRPHLAIAHNNRGKALLALKRPVEALGSYEQALALRPDCGEALHGRGLILLQVLNRPADALADLDRALAAEPGDAEIHHHRALALFALNRFADALAAYDRALELDPGSGEVRKGRGTALVVLRRPEEAAASYRGALAAGADPEEIHFLLAGLGAAPAPPIAPRKFITDLFDQHAGHFDHHLVAHLKYRGPEFIGAAVARATRGEQRSFDILDLGCGTGLVGERLRPLARALTGVDLSSRMLQQAKARNIYDHLICADLTEFLETHRGSFDLVVAGDVLIYVGDLSRAMQGVRRVLRGGGIFAFSVETNEPTAHEADDFVLRPRLRYAHSLNYLRRLADDNRLALEDIESVVIRQEEGTDVEGCVLVMRSRHR